MNEDAFEFEENAAAIVAVAMRQGLRAAEVERARRKRHVDQTAHDLTMRALPYALALDVEGNRRSLDLLDQAMERDPDHTLAIALAAWCQAQGVVYQFNDNPGQARAQALSFAQRAINIGGDPTALPILGNAFALAGDVQAADSVTRIALAFDGSSPWAWMRSGLIDVCKQRSETAVERLLVALDLARDDPLAFNSLIGIGCAHFDVGHHAEASHWYEQAIAEHPSGVWMHYLLCPAYMLCGRKPEARQRLGRLQRAYPELTISRVIGGLSFFSQSFRDRVANGLETAGMRS
jgi:tetratricopeptide (TPR) repeat protein